MFKTNQELSRIFYKLSGLLSMAEVDWKPAAYRKAAASIEAFPQDIRLFYKEGGIKALHEIEGVGEGIAKKIEQYILTKKIDEFERLKGTNKEDFGVIPEIPFMGPKKAMKLYEALGVKNIKDLEAAAKSHKICKIPSFGEKAEQDILVGIKIYKERGPRKPYTEAKEIADSIIEKLKKSKLTNRIVAAGSIRRKKSTIGDIDLLATSKDPEKLMNLFVALPEVKYILAKGPTKSIVVLNSNIQVDIRVIPPECWGAALLYFTGDKNYNIELRKKAIRLGYKLSEYGLFDRTTNKMLAGKTELEIYKKLGINRIIPPTSRERN